MVLLDYNVVRWNQSALLRAWYLCMKFPVDCSMSGHCCRSALDESQPLKLYLAIVGGCLSFVCLHAVLDPSPVTCCLAISAYTPPKPRLHSSSKTYQCNLAASIQDYKCCPNTARARKSPKNLQIPSPSAGVHLALFHMVLSPDT